MTRKSIRNTLCMFLIALAAKDSFAQDSTQIKWAVRFAPINLINMDRNIQLQGEYFTSPKISIIPSIGLGRINDENHRNIQQYRLGVKLYIKPINQQNRKSAYFGFEGMYKHSIETKNSVKVVGKELTDWQLYHLNVNVFAQHFIVGYSSFKPQKPSFDFFFGIGLRESVNFTRDKKEGYDFCCPTMYNRLEGSYNSISVLLGANIGISHWK